MMNFCPIVKCGHLNCKLFFSLVRFLKHDILPDKYSTCFRDKIILCRLHLIQVLDDQVLINLYVTANVTPVLWFELKHDECTFLKRDYF